MKNGWAKGKIQLTVWPDSIKMACWDFCVSFVSIEKNLRRSASVSHDNKTKLNHLTLVTVKFLRA